MHKLLKWALFISLPASLTGQLPLDLNIGTPVFPGTDPAVLPATGLNQAEPHITRDPLDPDRLLAVFQDGRFPDGGAVNNGYAVSLDGGFTWVRDTFPLLTEVSGGPYNRATDPVAGIDLNGRMYANALASIRGTFDLAAITIQTSDDSGSSWSAPVEIHRGTLDIGPDKNWMTINQNPGVATTGRILVTWSDFDLSGRTTSSIRLKRSYSDDRGASWSPVADLAPVDISNPFYQGTQPLYPRGDWCVVVYHHFERITQGLDGALEMTVSSDGGTTFNPTPEVILSNYRPNPDPVVRNGAFLPSAATNADTGDIHVVVAGQWPFTTEPVQILYFRTDAVYGDDTVSWNWRGPVPLPVDIGAIATYTPTITVDPSGQNISVFYLIRRSGSLTNLPVLLEGRVIQSQDGGQTWEASRSILREDVVASAATLTSRGYMLGDYYGFASPTLEDPSGVLVWMRDREDQIDPVTSRIAPPSLSRWMRWQVAQFSNAERQSGLAGPGVDFDGDGIANLLEASLGLPPNGRRALPDSSADLALLPSGDDWETALRGGEIWPDGEAATPVEAAQVNTGTDWITGFPDIPDWFVSVRLLDVPVSPAGPYVVSGPSFPWRVLEGLGSGWWHSPWFGLIQSASHPWLYAGQSGFLFRSVGSAADGVWLFHPVNGWIWTREDIHPYRYNASQDTWSRF